MPLAWLARHCVHAVQRSFTPFFAPEPGNPDAWRSIFRGASIAFFSFIGFDAVATAAEEVVDPAR